MKKRFMIYAALLALILASCIEEEEGCTDPLANNTETSASENDGTCTYDTASVSPVSTIELSDTLHETSGLIYWNGRLLTHNDNADTRLYELDIASGRISREFDLQGVENRDWEEISQDGDYIYVGDFGNNGGNRTDLHILRLEKASLLTGSPVIDTIWFSYSDQNDFSTSQLQQTEFDCEAFVVSTDHIFLFTKQWLTFYTSVYSIPKVPGDHVAEKKSTLNVEGLVTGASYLESDRLLVLCGYNNLLSPFLYLLYDYPGHDFFSGNKRKISVSLPITQVEGVATADGLIYYLTNEHFVYQSVFESKAALHQVDLSDFLEAYLQ